MTKMIIAPSFSPVKISKSEKGEKPVDIFEELANIKILFKKQFLIVQRKKSQP